MWSSSKPRLIILALWSAASLLAQDVPLDTQRGVKINLPPDSPVTLLSAAMGESRVTPRGAALVLDLHMSLMLRNATANRIHGVALRVVSQEVTVGGKAS